MKILVVNAGSSTLKLSLFGVGEAGGQACLLWSKQMDTTGEFCFETAMNSALNQLWQGNDTILSGPSDIDIVGHRVVHGGEKYEQATAITDAVFAEIKSLSELAPLHQPANIKGIEAAKAMFPQATQVAVFDTAFHQSLPEEAIVYPGPYSWYKDWHIRRYGFHGINHAYCLRRASNLLGAAPKRLITCHLGGGASLAAIKDGECVMTTMGYTPLEGLMMSTRSGSIDPGLLLNLLEQQRYSSEELSEVLERQSGLKGISGVSGDMRAVLKEMQAGNQRAALAVNMYIHSLVFYLGALLATLGGVDAIVFTAGIGENSAQIRDAVCKRLSFLGLTLEQTKNEGPREDRVISSNSSKVLVLSIYAGEDSEIAQQCLALK